MPGRVAFVALVFAALASLQDGRIEEARAGDPVAPVATGTLAVLVVDEKDRPIEGAVVWALGTKLSSSPPLEPVLLDQRGLEFRPRFLVARRGQTLVISNADPEAHNVHSSDACCAMNDMVPIGGKKERLLDQAGEVTFLCDIHAHMRCTLVVLDAIHARTDAQGLARLELPLGPRKLRARALDRERAEVEVTVAAVSSAAAPTRIVLPMPPRGPQVVPPEKLPWPTVAVRFREALDEAVRFARRGDAASARAAAEDASGTWFTGSQLYVAILESKGRHEAGELKSAILKLARRAEQAAEQGGDAVDQLARHVEKVANIVDDLARELPKR